MVCLIFYKKIQKENRLKDGFLFGGRERARTSDLYHVKVAL